MYTFIFLMSVIIYHDIQLVPTNLKNFHYIYCEILIFVTLLCLKLEYLEDARPQEI